MGAAVDLEPVDLAAVDLGAVDLEAVVLAAVDLEAVELEAVALAAVDPVAVDLAALDLEAMDFHLAHQPQHQQPQHSSQSLQLERWSRGCVGWKPLLSTRVTTMKMLITAASVAMRMKRSGLYMSRITTASASTLDLVLRRSSRRLQDSRHGFAQMP